jgi:hypothetical protein
VGCSAVSDGMFQGTAGKRCCFDSPGSLVGHVARVGAPTAQEPLPGSTVVPAKAGQRLSPLPG